MPQMAPSLWCVIYLFMCAMIIMNSNNLFFYSESKSFKHSVKNNKFMNLMWQ
uniref:ATP synthase F0 subunit 8 n=1 Tax=Metacrangonyx ilvanus TaxID=931575 RepID=K7ZVT4_9CRUS|nr:ATP synthase F0 subunit 8 [Metacrangonyx ilvanus]CCI69549.1 ATP synthase F0 subunit 8 [Metacrangonyx ilvanus]